MSEARKQRMFELVRYNPRRRARGAEAAEVKVTWPDGDEALLWMSEKNIADNIAGFGECDGLSAAREAYRKNVEYP